MRTMHANRRPRLARAAARRQAYTDVTHGRGRLAKLPRLCCVYLRGKHQCPSVKTHGHRHGQRFANTSTRAKHCARTIRLTHGDVQRICSRIGQAGACQRTHADTIPNVASIRVVAAMAMPASAKRVPASLAPYLSLMLKVASARCRQGDRQTLPAIDNSSQVL